MPADLQSGSSAPREGYIPRGNAQLYYRETGRGQPIIVLHGGPDFSHSYLLPDMDRLSDEFRLIYYDQRGRGRSSGNIRIEDISIASEVEDLDSVRAHSRLARVAVLGHSWGGLLAMEYAIRHPERVSHLILLNSAPASSADYQLFREERRKKTPEVVEKLKALSSTGEYAEGDLAAEAEYYRVHYGPTLRQPEQLDRLVQSLRVDFTSEGILRARAIEDRLMEDTWLTSGYDLLPALKQLSMPTLVIHGDYDFVPIECSTRIAEAIRGARFVLLRDCGHFSYMERPEEVRAAMSDFFEGA